MTKHMFCFYNSDDFYFDHASYIGIKEFPLHTHDICEVIFLRKGSGSYLVDGRTYQFAKNSLILSRPGESHAMKPNDNSEYERYNFLVDERVLRSDICTSIPTDVTVIHFEGNSLVGDLFKKADYYAENFAGDRLKAILLNLLEEVFYNVVLTSKDGDSKELYTVNPTIKKAVAYIEKNITRPLNINILCEELYITKSHLHQVFMKHLKTSPKKYIISKKLILAQRELRTGKKPMEVYLTCGFADYSTFYRDYKKYFGHSPSEEINTEIIRTVHS